MKYIGICFSENLHKHSQAKKINLSRPQPSTYKDYRYSSFCKTNLCKSLLIKNQSIGFPI